MTPQEHPDGAVSKADVVARLAGQRPEMPPSVAAPARTPVPADAEEEDGREALGGDLRRQLAAIIAHPKMPAPERRFMDGDACDRCPKALDAADAVIAAGFRLVSDDEATVDRVAAALAAADSAAGTALALSYEERWAMAREAIRAMQGGER